MEMQHLIRNVCKSSLEAQELNELHLQAIQHWQQDDDALAAILEMHHRIQRGEEEVSDHLSARANELMHAYSGARAMPIMMEHAPYISRIASTATSPIGINVI